MSHKALSRLTRTNQYGRQTTGFWLPVQARGDRKPGSKPGRFSIWMEEAYGFDLGEEVALGKEFVGSLRFGPIDMHVSAHAFQPRDDEHPEWHAIDDDWIDAFLGGYEDEPICLQIEGYPGWWALVAHPFC